MLILTNSTSRVTNIEHYRAGHTNMISFMDTNELDLLKYVNIEHINRIYNLGADDLAKQGTSKPNIIMGWV